MIHLKCEICSRQCLASELEIVSEELEPGVTRGFCVCRACRNHCEEIRLCDSCFEFWIDVTTDDKTGRRVCARCVDEEETAQAIADDRAAIGEDS